MSVMDGGQALSMVEVTFADARTASCRIAGVAAVDVLHPRRVPAEQLAGGGKLRADPGVLGGHGQELLPKRVVHACA